MQDRLMRTLDLDADLRRAVERDEFVLLYQPILDLDDGRIRAAEALVRGPPPGTPPRPGGWGPVGSPCFPSRSSTSTTAGSGPRRRWCGGATRSGASSP